jgi:hypothetical protein
MPRRRLGQAGFPVAADAHSVGARVGPDTRAQTRVPAIVIKVSGG